MGNQWDKDPDHTEDPSNQDEIDKQLKEITRVVVQGASEAQLRFKRVINNAGGYWQQVQSAPTPHQASDTEEQRLRQLVNTWSSENWRVTRDLGNYMDIVSITNDEVWRSRWRHVGRHVH